MLVAHYYVDPDIQDLAEATGGTVSDSLEMARFGHAHSAPPSWSPGCASWARPRRSSTRRRRVLMPDLEAECSLDLATPGGLSANSATASRSHGRRLCQYSAAVKARSTGW